jgi:cell division protease FtsH
MSDLGLVALDGDGENSYLGNDWPGRRPEHSEDIAARIDEQVRSIVNHCYEETHKIIENNRTVIDRLVDVLIEMETIEGEEFRRLVEQFRMELKLVLVPSS